jgi:D-alanine transaminase
LIPRFVYVDGRYCAYGDARIHVEDRGVLFADAVYEVCAVRAGRCLDLEPHLDRLERSLRELRIDMPMTRAALGTVMAETIRRNAVTNGLVYIQISRGVAARDHFFPDPAPRPTMIVLSRPVDVAALDAKAERGMSIVTAFDIRWGRRDIKSTGLLPNVLAKQAARDAGAGDVWFFDAQGFVTEGASANAWIVDAAGTLRTRHLSEQILPGVTRKALLPLTSALGLSFSEEPFTIPEALAAREAFSTSAVALVMPVVRIDGQQIGGGAPGPVAMKLRQSYLKSQQ